MRLIIPASIVFLAAGLFQAEAQTKAVVTLERHATSNVLDGPVELFDWYSSLRGTVETILSGDDDGVKLGLDASAVLHDNYDFEDDTSVAATAVVSRKLSRHVELRGTFSLRYVSEGDDLLLGALIVPIRTDTTTVAAAGEAGIDLGGNYALVLTAGASREDVGPSRLPGGLRAALEADTTRLVTTVAFRHTNGTATTGGEVQWRGVRPALAGGVLVAIGSDEIALKAELRRTLGHGIEVRLVAGVGRFAATGLPLEIVRPLYELALKVPLGRAELRGNLVGRFDTADSDDPLGSYAQRGEIEAGYRLAERLAVGAGLFLELKDNFLIGYDERSWGVYSEASWTLSPKLGLLFRIEHDRTDLDDMGISERTVDAFVRLSARTS